MTETRFLCPLCGSDQLTTVSGPKTIRSRGGAVLQFTDERSHCTACGEEFYTRDQSLASSRAAAKVVREHEGLLPPDRIKAIRESYGLSQADFERALRLGPKTVVRWESGTVQQGATANSLLLAIEGNSTTFWKVAASNGFAVPSTVLVHQHVAYVAPEKFALPTWLFPSPSAEAVVGTGQQYAEKFALPTWLFPSPSAEAVVGTGQQHAENFIVPARSTSVETKFTIVRNIPGKLRRKKRAA